MAALTAALALVALPGITGSRSLNAASLVDPAAFQPLQVTANAQGRQVSVGPLDPAFLSAGTVDATTAFVERGTAPTAIVAGGSSWTTKDPDRGKVPSIRSARRQPAPR